MSRTFPKAGYLQTEANNILCGSAINTRNTYIQNQPKPIRLKITSPYTGKLLEQGGSSTVTQEQLNMRRKVEILQHKKNSSNNARLTKSQAFSRLINAPFRQRTQQNSFNGVNNCTDDKYKPTLSTSADVPGPPIVLQLDENVELYNYAEPQQARSIFESEETIQPWNVNVNTNVFADDDVATNLFTLYINRIENTFTPYSFQFPIALYIQGNTSSGTSESFHIQNFSFQVLFDGAPLEISFSSNIAELQNRYLTINDATNGDFFAYQYIGVLEINNLTLPTQYGFVYDFSFKFQISTINENNANAGVFMNVLNSSDQYSNTTIVSPAAEGFDGFTFIEM
jgi:hypothetical protein